MARLNRRNMLKAMAATAGGIAGASSGLVLGRLPALAAASPTQPTTRDGGSPAVAVLRNPHTPATPGTTYKTWGMQSFSNLISSSASYGFTGDGRYSTVVQEMTALVDVPTGAVLTEMYIYVVSPTADLVWMLVQHPYLNNYTVVGNTPTVAMAGPQTLRLAAFAPIPIDGVTTVVALEWYSGVTDGTHSVMGYTAGWILNPGLTTFPNPRRVVSSSSTNGAQLGPFDATMTTGLTPSGVPAGAKAAFCAVQSYQPGVLTLYPDGAADPGIANYSGTGNLGASLNLVYMLVPLSAAGKFRIHSYINGNVYVDVWGYLA